MYVSNSGVQKNVIKKGHLTFLCCMFKSLMGIHILRLNLIVLDYLSIESCFSVNFRIQSARTQTTMGGSVAHIQKN